MTSARRIGAPEAKNRTVLLDAAEQLMLDDGYAAVTSRRVAERAGLKPQLVHYYFRTMDELFLEVFRRHADQGMRAHQQALESDTPLWALWRFGINPAASRLTMEMAALANHRKALRAEISRYAERFREEQREAFVIALRRHSTLPDEVPPVVWSVLLTGLSTVVAMGEALGVSGGHAETVELVERYLRLMEGDPPPA
jgi:AcrR family transcriptional regulator